jgi:hypothetical protein
MQRIKDLLLPIPATPMNGNNIIEPTNPDMIRVALDRNILIGIFHRN